ncbi:MAG: hypothetical protein QOG52_1376, partial [Frankiaceae bacterium]|nr:hypothetical protein [Frankiaceae bacterium]
MLLAGCVAQVGAVLEELKRAAKSTGIAESSA